MFTNFERLIVKQRKEWLEIFTGWETKNQYTVSTEHGEEVGYVVEKGSGFFYTLKRLILRSHRPLEIEVTDLQGNSQLSLSRPFFWFFSDLQVTNSSGKKLGSIHRQFGIIYKKYTLLDSRGKEFSTIRSPIWRLWTFPILNRGGAQQGTISKKWQGILKEAFTDADAFLIDLKGTSWNESQKPILFAASISVDFDFFENNQGNNSSVMDMLD